MKIIILIIFLLFTTNIMAGDYTKGLKDPKTQEKTLNEILAFGEDADVNVKTLLNLLKKDDEKISKLTFKVILTVGSDAEIEKAILIAVKSKHKTIVAAAINKLKNLKDKVLAANITISLLGSKDELIKEKAILMAGDLKIKKSIDKLSKILLDTYITQDISLNKQAAKALGQIRDAKVIPILIKGLFIKKNFNGTNNKGATFVFARNSLYNFGKDALKEVIKALNNENSDFNSFVRDNKLKPSDVRYNLIIMIGDFGSKSSYKVLEKYINDESLAVRLLTEKIIGKFKIRKSAFALIKKYKKLKKELGIIKDSTIIQNISKEINQINYSLAMIAGRKAEKHFVKEILSKPLKVNNKIYDKLIFSALESFLNTASYKYYKVYKKAYKRTKDNNRKQELKRYLNIMSVAKKCKNKVKCYAKYLDDKKDIKDINLYNSKRIKAVYMLSRFKRGKKRKLALSMILKKGLLNKDFGTRKASIIAVYRLARKSDIPKIEKFIKKANDLEYLKKEKNTFNKILINLKK